MTRVASLIAFLLLAAPAALAQQADEGLNDQQRLGRQLFAQSCGVCHLRPSLNVRTYGPLLSKASTGGDEGRMRNTILEGTTRMPAFKYYLQTGEVDAIIAYIKTVPAPTVTAAAPAAAPPD